MKNIVKYASLVFALLMFTLVQVKGQKDLRRVVSVEELDETFKDWNNLENPGIAVGIVTDGKIVHTRGYGLANMEYDLPVKTDTKFYIGELSNQFTVYALLLLESSGKLSLQDDIKKYLPQFPKLDKQISIEDLINHTSGIRDLEVTKELMGWKESDETTDVQVDQLFKSQQKLNTDPGKKYQDNNSTFLLLERTIANASGEEYTDYIQKNIFDVLGMKSTSFDIPSGGIIKNKATGYYPQGEGFISSTLKKKDSYNTNVYSTVGDMCLWLQNYYNPKSGNTETLKKFMDPARLNDLPVEEKMYSLYFNQLKYWDYNGTKKLYQIFVGGGYACKIVHFPDQKMSAIVLGNGGRYNGGMATITGKLYVKNYFVDPPTKKEVKGISMDVSRLKEFTGDYWEPNQLYTRSIYLKNDTLMYSRGNNESPIIPIGKNKFQILTSIDVFVTFENGADGKIMVVEPEEGVVFEHQEYNKDATWTKDLSAFVGEYYCETLHTRYFFAVEDNKLVARNLRVGTIEFMPILKDSFTGNRGYFNELKFVRNSKNNIDGFELSTYKEDKIMFKKVSIGQGQVGNI